MIVVENKILIFKTRLGENMMLEREILYLDGFHSISALEIHLNTRTNHGSIIAYPSRIMFPSFILCLHHVLINISSFEWSLHPNALFLLFSLFLSFSSHALILTKWKHDMTCVLMSSWCLYSLFYVVIDFWLLTHLMFVLFTSHYTDFSIWDHFPPALFLIGWFLWWFLIPSICVMMSWV